MMNRLVLAAAASVILLGLVGCSSATGTPDSSKSSSAAADQPTQEPAAEALPDPVFTDAGPAGSPAMAMNGDSFDPANLTVAVGDIVTFTSGDDKIHALVANGLASVTVAKGLPEYYQFNDKGVYTVMDEISEVTATITVQ